MLGKNPKPKQVSKRKQIQAKNYVQPVVQVSCIFNHPSVRVTNIFGFQPCFVRLEKKNYDRYKTDNSPVQPSKKRRAISPVHYDQSSSDESSEDEEIFDIVSIEAESDDINVPNAQ